MNKEIKISDRERLVLVCLAEYWNDDCDCLYMRTIAKETKLEIFQVKRSVRSLARKGLTEYVRGLFDEDGMVAGSGYRATREGAVLVKGCKDCKDSVVEMTDGRCGWCWQKRVCKNCGKTYTEHDLKDGHRGDFEFEELPTTKELLSKE